MDISKTKLSINYINSERTIFLKCHAYKLAIVRAAEKSAKLHNIFAAKAMLSTLKARYHRLSVQLQVNKSWIQNKQTFTFTVQEKIWKKNQIVIKLVLAVLQLCCGTRGPMFLYYCCLILSFGVFLSCLGFRHFPRIHCCSCSHISTMSQGAVLGWANTAGLTDLHNFCNTRPRILRILQS